MLREKSDIHQEEGILPPDGDMDTPPEFQGLKTRAPVFHWVSSLQACPRCQRLVSPHNFVSRFLKMNLSE